MAPSTSLQARITAFENLSSNPKLAVPSPPKHQRQQLSKITPGPHLLDGDPTSPTSDSLASIPALQPSLNPPRSSSPPVLGRKSSLIDFSELSASVRLKNDTPLSPYGTDSASFTPSFLDPLQKPQVPPRPHSQIPPLPPRKASQNSLKNSPTLKGVSNLPIRSSPISIASSRLSYSESLLDPPTSTHPASNSSDDSIRHLPASSISSFQSVSLSSGGIHTPEESLDGSYEAVSSTAATSPITESQSSPMNKLRAPKSGLYLVKSSLHESSPLEPSSTFSRRQAPPLPPKPHLPNTPRLSSGEPSLLRRVPIPTNARRRYDALFDRHMSLSQKSHSTSGWRGPSFDLLTGIDIDDSNELPHNIGLSGPIVKSVWKCSKLPNSFLREIWCDLQLLSFELTLMSLYRNECDPNHTGSLNKDAFALGMWRIDEALRIRQQSRGLTSLKKPSTPHSANLPLPPLPNRNTNVTYTPRVPYATRKMP